MDLFALRVSKLRTNPWRLFLAGLYIHPGKLVSLKFQRNVSVVISTQRGTIPMESPFQH
jgi:hypothetical protein